LRDLLRHKNSNVTRAIYRGRVNDKRRELLRARPEARHGSNEEAMERSAAWQRLTTEAAEATRLQGISRSRQQAATARALMVRKGSPVRVRQRALGNRAAARFSSFWIGFSDPFRALPDEKGSGVAVGERCAVPLRLAAASRR
jgi:hypothetical protein